MRGSTTSRATPIRTDPSTSPQVVPDARDVAVARLAHLGVGQRHDGRRAAALGRRQLERPGSRLAREGVGTVERQPAGIEPHRAGAWQPGRAGVRAAAIPEHVETRSRPGDRVRLGARQVQDAVACAHRVGASVLPAEALTGEHVEELLLVTVHVDGHRALAGREPVAAEPGAVGPRGGAETPARAAQVAPVDHGRLDLVPVREHPSEDIAGASLPARALLCS
jgi:hypothetical protein